MNIDPLAWLGRLRPGTRHAQVGRPEFAAHETRV